MFQKVTEYLTKRGWSYSKKDDDSVFISLTHDNGTYHCVFYIREEINMLALVSYLGTHCPPDKLDRVLKLINSANNNMLYGNFEINSAGDIKHRTSVHLENIEVTDDIIEDMITRNIYNIDLANPIFSKVMFGDMTNDDAYDRLFPYHKPESSKKEIEDIESVPVIENKPDSE